MTCSAGPLVEVIEIRKAANGYVITALTNQTPFINPDFARRGYETYVCGDSVEEVKRTVEHVLAVRPLQQDVKLPLARHQP